jgi:hypothetical protein
MTKVADRPRAVLRVRPLSGSVALRQDSERAWEACVGRVHNEGSEMRHGRLLLALVPIAPARPCAAADSPSALNCKLDRPPASAGEEFDHGVTLRIYPRAVEIGSTYSGCQTLWFPKEGGWQLLSQVAKIGHLIDSHSCTSHVFPTFVIGPADGAASGAAVWGQRHVRGVDALAGLRRVQYAIFALCLFVAIGRFRVG